MIKIQNRPLDVSDIAADYPDGCAEREIIDTMQESEDTYYYDSLRQLGFELNMRREIVAAAEELKNSGMNFKVFRESECNPEYWTRTADGGFLLKNGVRPSDAIRDIFKNGSLYGTECATAMMIVYYKALLAIFPEDAFDNLFGGIYLMDWSHIDRELRDVGIMKNSKGFFPGDRRYFSNPDVNPLTPEMQGENVIDMGGGLFYGHGIGIFDGDTFIKALNLNRAEDADESALLMDSAGRPDFRRLSDLYDGIAASPSSRTF